MRNLRKIIILVALGVVVFAIGFVGYSMMHASDYALVAADGPDFSYTLQFAKNAEQSVKDGNSILKGRDQRNSQIAVVTIGPAKKLQGDCFSSPGSTISIISNDNVNGEKHPLCYSKSLNVYEANFRSHGAWYFLAVQPEVKGAKLSADTAKTLASSIKIY
jgi:hypothetical protein